MDDTSYPSLKLLHHFQISPAAAAAAVNLPLTFLDYPWLLCRPMQRLFFYDFPHPTHHFIETILPELNLSLSAALRHFFPLAGRLVSPPPPHLPHLVCDSPNSSVPLTVAESTADFDQIVACNNNDDPPRDATELRPFVPKLPDSVLMSDGTKFVSLLALQITIFPWRGLCIGGEFAHVVSDGMGFHHFVKFWAALFKSRDNITVPFPSHDRELIRRAYPDLESALLNQWFQFRSSWDFDSGPVKFKDLTDKVRSTFLITPENIEKMKIWVRKINTTSFHLSSFVLTSAFIWITLIKSDEPQNDDVLYHMSFVADCRRRLPIGLPETYFGNCLGIYYVPIKRSDAVSDEGVARAAEAIGRKVDELGGDGDGGRSGLLKGVERWIPGWKELSEGGRLMATAGSPKLKAYDTDFGWGKPRKSEVVQVDSSGAVSLCESGDGSGGIEVGLAMERRKMAVFRRLFDDFLSQI
ncbi:Coumaroyl-CoA:anthocyanidin 3-O-glucoside-6''-O-coumaroyltransferase 2 [Linum perenne]